MFLVIICSFTGVFSSVAGAIYYPVLQVIQGLFEITEEQVNITIVVYFIFQGIAPSIIGNLADSMGRRPIVIIAVTLYFCACVGLSCCNNYAQLVGLRCLQAAGISPVIAMNSGIMGDVTTRAERAGYVGYVSGFQIIGTALGALIGARLSSRWGWRGIFWFLAIGYWCLHHRLILALPETKRAIVGDGSITPPNYFSKAPILVLPSLRKRLHLNSPDYESKEEEKKISPLEPLHVFKILDIVIMLVVSGLQYTTWTAHQTALTTSLSRDYHYFVVQIGLCFLPTGICTMISVVGSGKYLNFIYGRMMQKHLAWLENEKQILLEKNANDSKKVDEIISNDPYYTFNLCKARLQPGLFTLLLSSCGFIAYSWCLGSKVHVAAILCFSGFASLFSICMLTMSTTLIVDLFPETAAIATACLNLVRCSMSAIIIACLTRMKIKMQYGGIFTFLSLLTACSSLLLLKLIRNGKVLSFEKEQKLSKTDKA
ncbi:hypothetical protein TBLA_0H00750 [Henningerozyma blattae CBS 6284]|uniref:Major facilitator superfamily (MFS) profile domain-containing protein n=1 Tax=Henningerozyma blattae (strain ATCC 34711 / CBS 6284 / DSM 70876 / NBRC 10599 / NRRL Y-10934 / UCD 77-7) TaxID=1071380 RepID=I2H7L2_HENB6|nr:hypothetical protein TBLA_0H00750 [Tetrapisispora blattae CBS 6284]CCH62364.1 hypothetical protein TBLA_0H00750 [Tetrapisispora blattae CBS 6284]